MNNNYFADKFFEDLEDIFRKYHRDYAEVFFYNLRPTFLQDDKNLDKMIPMLEKAVKTDNTHFIKLLKEEI